MIGARPKPIVCSLVAIVLASQVAGEYDGHGAEILGPPRVERMHPETSDDCVGSNCIIHNAEGALGAIWFGPRLGRRRRSDAKYIGKGADSIGEVLGAPTFNFITIPDGESNHQGLTYTPRQGHEWNRIDDQSSMEQEPQQTLPIIFTPRLGRNRMTPRFQREIRNLLHKLQLQMQ